jgi:cytochrome c553
MMKVMSLRLALLTAVLAIAFPAMGRADGGFAGHFSKQELRAKLFYCKTCHGIDGQGFRGYYPIPRLAGQQTKYLENQLHAFLDHRRTHPVMSAVANSVKPWMIQGLAENFENLTPPPYGGAPRSSWALGKKIFQEGLPESNVPACFACHGPDAHGHNEIPRLAGQLYWYTVGSLSNWTKERGLGAPDISRIMVPTTHNLTHAQVEAVAAYISTLK